MIILVKLEFRRKFEVEFGFNLRESWKILLFSIIFLL